nr:MULTISPECIES: hypothetical protein [unclassified Micromonospora]
MPATSARPTSGWRSSTDRAIRPKSKPGATSRTGRPLRAAAIPSAPVATSTS